VRMLSFGSLHLRARGDAVQVAFGALGASQSPRAMVGGGRAAGGGSTLHSRRVSCLASCWPGFGALRTQASTNYLRSYNHRVCQFHFNLRNTCL
jgi:hypothetical protein